MQLSQGGRAAKAWFWSTHREIMDAAVIFAIAVMACGATIYFNGLEQLHNLSREYQGWELNAVTSVLLFSGIALSVYGMRRMADQRREKKRRRAAERHAHALALKDPLTRLPNRVRFEQEVAAALSTAQDAGTTVLLMGLVGLQAINDAHGYAGGDTVVAQVAARLRESVGAEGLLARFGDDAFAVCLRSNDPHKAGKVAGAMVECLNDPVAIGEDEPLSALRRSVPNSWTRESWSGVRMSRSTAAKAPTMPIASSTRTPMRRCANNRSWIGFGLPARRPEQSLFRHGRAAVADIHFARRTLSSG